MRINVTKSTHTALHSKSSNDLRGKVNKKMKAKVDYNTFLQDDDDDDDVCVNVPQKSTAA